MPVRTNHALKALLPAGAVIVASLLAAGCATDDPYLALTSPTIESGTVDSYGAPSVLAMRDDDVEVGATTPASHLTEAIRVTPAQADCIVDLVEFALPAGEFPALRFAELYTSDRDLVTDAVVACTDPAEIAALLVTSDDDLAQCVSSRAYPRSSALLVSAIASSAVEGLTEAWPNWLPESRQCLFDQVESDHLEADPSTSLPPDNSTEPESLLDDADATLAALGAAPDGYVYAPTETGGFAPLSEELVGELASIGFEVYRTDGIVPEALVWGIAWNADEAGEAAVAAGWLEWLRAGGVIGEELLAGIPVERLGSTPGGPQVLFTSTGVAVLVADTGGGVEVIAQVLAAVADSPTG
jgi:hypothetical protein